MAVAGSRGLRSTRSGASSRRQRFAADLEAFSQVLANLAKVRGMQGEFRQTLLTGAVVSCRKPRGRVTWTKKHPLLTPLLRASTRSTEEHVRTVFDDACGQGGGPINFEDLRSFMCDHLGFGQAEVRALFERFGGACVTFNDFREGFADLNPFQIQDKSSQVIIRKPGSLGQQVIVNLQNLEDCEVYVCDPTAQVFMDGCKRCIILLAPCHSSVFVRTCEDCFLWVAAQQLRTNECTRCCFHLFSKTAPIIEKSEDLAFGPWSAWYPSCARQFAEVGLSPERNLWNAIFDFTGRSDASNWRILALAEVRSLRLELPSEGGEPENPAPPVTHEALCAEPLPSGAAGDAVACIPQTRPELPPPSPGASPLALHVSDAAAWAPAAQRGCVGAARLRG